MGDTSQNTRAAATALNRCRKALGGVEQGLSDLMRGRERVFLDLGNDLMRLESGCEGLSQNAGELAACSSGLDLHEALDRSAGELAALTSAASDEAGQESLRDIGAVAGIIEELSSIVSAFARVVKHLSMLGIATRIESARLGGDGRGFSTLADDVEKLAHQIVEHCAGIAAKVEALRGHVASARESTLSIIRAQEKCFELISRELTANFADLAAMSERSARLSDELSRSAAAIRADIGQAVRSLQFHDIVRQQIEHVAQALSEVNREIDEAQTEDHEDLLDLAAFVADVLALQDSQLDSADTHFTDAANRLRDSLSSLAERIRGIAAAIVATVGEKAGDSPLGRVEAGIATVKGQMGDFAAQGEALGGIMDSVAATISGMGGTIEAIEDVGAEIELIAINASIKAAHTGTAGAALGVLALAIQRLSVDARRLTDDVARILKTIFEASRTLQETASRHNDQSASRRVVDELDGALGGTRACSERSLTLFADLRDQSAALGERAAGIARGIDFDKDIGARLAAIRRTLTEQAAVAGDHAPPGGGRSARLRGLYDRYTMEAERAVHEAALGLAPGAAAKPAAGPAAATDTAGAFGDNVELF